MRQSQSWLLGCGWALAFLFVNHERAAGQVLGPDFNGDGYADLIVGTPDETVAGLWHAGAVQVMRGSAQGLKVAGNQFWHLNSPQIIGDCEFSGIFGAAMAGGDLDGDGYDEMVVASRNATINGAQYAGAVNVLFGSANSVKASGNQRWHQDSPGIGNWAEEGDNFGWALAIADFNQDGFADLAISAPGESIGAIDKAGGVHILYGRSTGPTASGNQLWHLNVSGSASAAETDDALGAALAAGDFNGDGYPDLAIGAPGKTVNGRAGAGATFIVYGRNTGLRVYGNQLFTLDSPGVAGTAVASDGLGGSLTVGDFNGDGFDDLAAGAPGKNIAGQVRAGAVLVLRGSTAGLTATGSKLWYPENAGGGHSSAADDAFGWKIAAGDFNRDGRSDLAIGIPNRMASGWHHAGSVHILYGASNGLSNAKFWRLTENSPGMGVGAETHSHFGYAVAARDFNGDGFADLAIGSPYKSVDGVAEAGVMHVLYGRPSGLHQTGKQTFTQNTPGMAGGGAAAGDEFADYF